MRGLIVCIVLFYSSAAYADCSLHMEIIEKQKTVISNHELKAELLEEQIGIQKGEAIFLKKKYIEEVLTVEKLTREKASQLMWYRAGTVSILTYLVLLL